MAHTDTEDSVRAYRVAQIEEMGFPREDAIELAKATRLVTNKQGGRTYFYDQPVTWHDVRKLIDAGATHAQILAILL